MNRPTNAPCWVVYTECVPSGFYYLASPSDVRTIKKNGTAYDYEGYFTLTYVEPFLDEVSAIAAALLCDGKIQRFEATDKVDAQGSIWERSHG